MQSAVQSALKWAGRRPGLAAGGRAVAVGAIVGAIVVAIVPAMVILQEIRVAHALTPVVATPVPIRDESGSSGRVTPEAGGTVPGPQPADSITFPPSAVSTVVTVTFESLASVEEPVAADLVPLAFFALSAVDEDGQMQSAFARSWSADFAFGKCEESGSCLWDVIDEASIHCQRFDDQKAAWFAVDSLSDVFADRLHCGSDKAGEFAIVAEIFETAGTGGGKTTFLPMIR